MATIEVRSKEVLEENKCYLAVTKKELVERRK